MTISSDLLRRAAIFYAPLALLSLLFASAGTTFAAPQRATPARIVSIIPSATEMLYALGLGDRVVADTANCDYPPAAKLKPHIGDMNINIETVVALKPDLVVGDSVWNAADIARLKELRLNIFDPHPITIEDVETEINQLGAATGAGRQAKIIVTGMQAKVSLARRLAGQNKRRPRVLCLVGYDPLYVAGPGTFVGEMVSLAGGANVVRTQGFPSYSKETAVASMPDIIFCGAQDAKRIAGDPAWQIAPAVREKHIYTIASDLLDRPGPRLADGLVQVARLIHADAQ